MPKSSSKPSSSKAGRPRILDDAKRREIAALVSAGYGIAGAARYLRCSARTIRREIGRNAEFREQLSKAGLSAELEPLRAIRSAAGKNWRAAAWLLERTDPDKYARRAAKAYTEADMAYLAEQMAVALIEEVSDPALCARVMARLQTIDVRAGRELGKDKGSRRGNSHA